MGPSRFSRGLSAQGLPFPCQGWSWWKDVVDMVEDICSQSLSSCGRDGWGTSTPSPDVWKWAGLTEIWGCMCRLSVERCCADLVYIACAFNQVKGFMIE